MSLGITILPPLLIALLVTAPQIPGAASRNECAECHLRLVWTRSEITHVDQWVTSRHALYRIGCEQCHRGDVRTSDWAAAHRGVANSADRSSSVNRTALPETCGRCHVSEANAFSLSAHEELLSQGDATAPTCTSCHTSMASDVLSPGALEQQCLHCHGTDPQNRAHLARRQLEAVVTLRTALRRARLEIAGIRNDDRRAGLTARWVDADRSLRGAVAGLHAFDQRRADDRLSDVRAQIDGLTVQLAR
jgi:hypothetical protein